MNYIYIYIYIYIYTHTHTHTHTHRVVQAAVSPYQFSNSKGSHVITVVPMAAGNSGGLIFFNNNRITFQM
jgi:hypothetical protein